MKIVGIAGTAQVTECAQFMNIAWVKVAARVPVITTNLKINWAQIDAGLTLNARASATAAMVDGAKVILDAGNRTRSICEAEAGHLPSQGKHAYAVPPLASIRRHSTLTSLHD